MDLPAINGLKGWATKYCSFDIYAESSLNKVFNSYLQYTHFEKEQISLSKKTFSKYFKQYLTSRVEQGTVKITRKSEIIFKGVEVFDNQQMIMDLKNIPRDHRGF